MIFRDPMNLKVFIRPGSTDMRKAINGLSMMVQETMKLDPFSEALFAFCSKNRKTIKLLYWDGNGFCLWQKRLEKGRFPWPDDARSARELPVKEFSQLLRGIDFRGKHEVVYFKKTG